MGCSVVFVLLLGLREDGMDIGDDSASGDRGLSEEIVELNVVLDGQLDVARDDAILLVVLGGVAGELEKLGDEVLKNRGHVHRGTSANALGEATALQEAAEATNREGQTSLGGLGLASASLLAAGTLVSLSGHVQ